MQELQYQVHQKQQLEELPVLNLRKYFCNNLILESAGYANASYVYIQLHKMNIIKVGI